MTRTLVIPPVQIKASTIQGFGVFATRDIQKGEIIEECVCLLISPRADCLTRYDYSWPQGGGISVLALGNGSIYNHSDYYNADHSIQVEDRLMQIVANRLIKKDEEIFVYYGERWFEERKIVKINKFSREKLKAYIKYFIKLTIVIGVFLTLKWFFTKK